MRKFVTSLVLAALFGLPAPARADAPPVNVQYAWARATPGHSDVAAVFLSVTSDGGDRLIGVTSPAAARAELHLHTMENGIMQMQQVDGVDLPPGQKIVFTPSGYHIMLYELKGPLKAGAHFPLTLTFDKAAPVTVPVAVRSLRSPTPDNAAQPMSAMPGMTSMPGMGSMSGMNQGH